MTKRTVPHLWGAALSIAMVLASAFGARGAVVDKTVMDSLWHELALARTPQDSIPILYDLFDYQTVYLPSNTSRELNKDILNRLYDVAMRAKDTTTAYEAVRYMSAWSRYDVPYIDNQLRRISHMPETTLKHESETFLRLQRYFWTLRDTTLSETKRRENFNRLRAEADKNKGPKTIYDRVDQQFALVLYGCGFVKTEELEKYLLDLRRFVEMVSDKQHFIKSYYYRIAAILFDENENGLKSIETDRKMLEILDANEAYYQSIGRKFKNFDNQRFTIYRRMLGNYEYLSDDSVRAVHREAERLWKEMPPGQFTPVDHEPVEAMWYMYNKEYSKALPLLRKMVNTNAYKGKSTYILAYIRAASAMNAADDLRKGQKMYVDMLTDRARDAADTEYARMRVQYEIDTLEASAKSAAKFAEQAEQKSREVSNEIFTYGVIAVAFFLLVIIIIQLIARRRSKIINDRLERTNSDLLKERDNLRNTQLELEKANEKARQAARQKDEFVNAVSHEISEPVKAIVGFSQLITDSIPEERRKYLERFVEVLDHNSNILQRIVGDLLDTAEIDDAVAKVTITHFQPEQICRLVAESYSPRLGPGQSIEVTPLEVIGSTHDNDNGVDSDATRLEQILINLLSNSVKFAPKGVITVSPTVDHTHHRFVVTVTDGGPGIPEGKEEVIFERFEKLGHYSEGLGLGLFVSREYARMLEGDIKVDTSYKGGARFIVTLPLSIRPTKNDKWRP